MPTYEYVCDACEHSFDEFQYFSDPVLTKCPSCKKKKLRRAFGTGAAVLFKGAGFYETDYRSESYKSGAKADAEAHPKPAGESKAADAAPAGGTAGTTGKAAKKSKAGKVDGAKQ
jgi:putative FmdB family regulatory protein